MKFLLMMTIILTSPWWDKPIERVDKTFFDSLETCRQTGMLFYNTMNTFGTKDLLNVKMSWECVQVKTETKGE